MIPLAEQIAEVQRELALRRKLYPGWVQAGTLPSAQAYARLAALEAVLETLRTVERQQGQLDLFRTRGEG